jgi:hypothetical protein
MLTLVEEIQQQFEQSGWSAGDAKFVTLNGGTLWLVSARRKGHSFSAQGVTQREAWRLAWQLAAQLRLAGEKPAMIVPLRRPAVACRCAG